MVNNCLAYTKGILRVYDWQGGVCSFERRCKGTTKIDFLLSNLDSRYFRLAIMSRMRFSLR